LHPGTIDNHEGVEGYFGSSRVRTGYFPIVRCLGCGLVQMRPHDDDQALSRAYAGLATDATYALGTAAQRLARAQVELVARHRPPPARVLDVGSGGGAFLGAALEKGFNASGLEPSSECIRVVTERLPAVRIAQGMVESADIAAGSYDVVTLWDVLEHLADPRAIVQRIASWLVPGGLLLVQLPDADSLPAKLLGPHWPLLLREHLSYFNEATITRLLEEAGYRVVSVRPCLRYFPLAHLAGRLGQLGLPVTSVSAVLGRLVVAAPAGEMRVVAKYGG
jgi:SAM-dependent methyltransferase